MALYSEQILQGIASPPPIGGGDGVFSGVASLLAVFFYKNLSGVRNLLQVRTIDAKLTLRKLRRAQDNLIL